MERDDPAQRLPIAVNTFVWHSPLTEAELAPTLRKLAGWGYEAVELACEDLGDWQAESAAALLRELGLRSVVGGVFGPGRELALAEPEVITRTQQYVRGCIDLAVSQGSELVIGPLYTSVGRTFRLSAAERQAAIRQLRESLAPLVDHAAGQGVRLAIEPLNRYETSLLTTTEQALELIDPLPAEGIGLNLDTYHMNIEERSLTAAFRAAGDRLLHLQVCGNDRGTPVDDHQDWTAIGAALAEIDYRGFLGFESFTADNASIATAASIWRSFAPTQDALALGALEQLRSWRSGWA